MKLISMFTIFIIAVGCKVDDSDDKNNRSNSSNQPAKESATIETNQASAENPPAAPSLAS